MLSRADWYDVLLAAAENWPDDGPHLQPKQFVRGLVRQGKADEEQLRQAQAENERLRQALDEPLMTWGFWTLVEIARRLADYPADVFDGSSGDPGPVFIARLREALAALPQEPAQGKPE